jgi:hypothetical protein
LDEATHQPSTGQAAEAPSQSSQVRKRGFEHGLNLTYSKIWAFLTRLNIHLPLVLGVHKKKGFDIYVLIL